jgi:hypothetical protein
LRTWFRVVRRHPERKTPVEGLRIGWEDHVKMVKEIVRTGCGQIDVGQETDRWSSDVNTVINLIDDVIPA